MQALARRVRERRVCGGAGGNRHGGPTGLAREMTDTGERRLYAIAQTRSASSDAYFTKSSPTSVS